MARKATLSTKGKKKLVAAAPKSRIVSGAVTIALASESSKAGLERAKRVEAAMSKAILDAIADGITDPEEQRKLILEARNKALEEDASG